jgi:hypothetical protein
MLSRLGHVRFLALSLGFLLIGARASAGPINFHVDVNTSSVAGTVGSLEFEFASNSGNPPGSATLTKFVSDGSVQSPPYAFFANFSGGLPNTLVISETLTQSADIGQDFNFGKDLQFNVSLSEPGAFSLFLWDAPGGNGNNLLSSTDPSAAGAALVISVDNKGKVTFQEGIGVTAVQLVPEPSSLTLFGVVAAGWIGRLWWRRRRT